MQVLVAGSWDVISSHLSRTSQPTNTSQVWNFGNVWRGSISGSDYRAGSSMLDPNARNYLDFLTPSNWFLNHSQVCTLNRKLACPIPEATAGVFCSRDGKRSRSSAPTTSTLLLYFHDINGTQAQVTETCCRHSFIIR